MNIEERFKKYIAIDTISDENSTTFPSTQSQIEFGKILLQDLKELGLENCYQDEFGYIYGRIDNNCSKTIGLIAHMDTAPTFPGGCKNTLTIRNYDGEDVTLANGLKVTNKDFFFLKLLKGEDLIFTDGEHLLGGDDKAGIVIIFDVIEYFLKHKEELTYNLAICFTPDEEIGLGASKFDVNKMKADIAYTLDGGPINYASYENFNAASAKIIIEGVNIHPGSAKNIMQNACLIGNEIISALPPDMIPAKTEEYEGFIHLEEIKGDVNHLEMSLILRDHDLNLLNEKKHIIEDAVRKAQENHLTAKISLSIKESYFNMAPQIIKNPEVIELINKVYLSMHEMIKYVPIRGGTDGATITYMGLPCPNLGDGDFNCHGRYEFVSITQMKKMVEILKNLLKLH
ncbi:MAG: peptidase T [Candidatus Onthovivens sp.]|nr:peptidase T [Candidatus Onthovivens sp.]